jgi:hyaluronoglucosaminidase
VRSALLPLLLTLAAACGPSPSSPPPPDTMPRPRYLAFAAAARDVTSACVDASALASHARLDALAPALLAAAGLRAAAPADCQWRLRVTSDLRGLAPAAAAVYAAAPAGAERYAVTSDGNGATTLVAADERAAWYALRAALAASVPRAAGVRVVRVTLADFADVPVRGIIEGFYGAPYAPDERLAVLTRMAALRQNRYLYAPQNDDYAHDQWAAPYPADAAQPLADAAAFADAHLIDFVWGFRPAINLFGYSQPANSIKFSSDADFARATAKLDSLRALGVRRFALLVDDSQPMLYWPEDSAAFATLAAAHASLANRLHAYLMAQTPPSPLLFIGTAYTSANADWQSYNADLGAQLDPAIEVMWTGPQTYSATIAPGDVDGIDQFLGRRVIIWDNAPTSIAPLVGRSPLLPRSIDGLLSNAVMNEWRQYSVAQFLDVMGPLGLYAWNAAAYDPDAAMAWWQARVLAPPPF